MKTVQLTRGKVALVNDQDFLRVSERSWNAQPLGKTWYAQDGRERVRMHRLIMGAKPGEIVDHINGNGLDNRRSNLRICTHRQNIINRRGANSNSKSGVRGVYWCKRAKRWAADVSFGKSRMSRVFKNKTAAARAVKVFLRYVPLLGA